MEERSGLVTADGAPVPLKGVKARATVAGRTAKYAVSQRFRNDELVPIECAYKFPLPESAAVCGFRAEVGDRVVEGAVEARETAFAKYDDALAAGDGAMLLDEERPNVFTLSVGNVEPGVECVVVIDWAAPLETRGKEERLVIPATITPRYVPESMPDEEGRPAADAVTPPYALAVPYGLSIEVAVEGRETVAALVSPSHPIRTAFEGDRALVSFAAGEAAMDRDFVLAIERTAEAALAAVAAPCPGGGMVVAVDLAFAAPDQAPAPREVVFLLDCSGSMAGSSIASARDALAVFLRGLEPGSSFNVIRFGSRFEAFFPRAVDYDESPLAAALGRLAKTDADLGGTEALPPLRAVLASPPAGGRPRAVILVTDGAVGNEDEILALAREHAGSTRMFAVGIGHGPNDFFLAGLARAGGGAFERIAPGEPIERKILRLFRKVTTDPVAGIRVDWRATPADATPVPAQVYAGEPVTLFARFEGAAPESIYVEGNFPGGGELGFERPVERRGEGTALPALYARAAIRALEEGAAAGSAQADRRAAADKARLVDLSKRFGVLCRETSFVAVEVRAADAKTTDRAQLRKVPVAVTAGYGGLDRGRVARPPSVMASVCFAAIPAGAGPLAPPPPCPKPAPYPAPRKKARAARGRGLVSRLVGSPPPPAEAERDEECAAPVRARSAAPREVADAPARPLYLRLLDGQRAAGGFDFDDAAIRELFGLDPAELDRAVAGLPVAPPDPRRRAVTALALALLEAKCGDDFDAWDPLVAKSRRLVAGDAKLLAWARDEVERK